MLWSASGGCRAIQSHGYQVSAVETSVSILFCSVECTEEGEPQRHCARTFELSPGRELSRGQVGEFHREFSHLRLLTEAISSFFVSPGVYSFTHTNDYFFLFLQVDLWQHECNYFFLIIY